MGWRGEDRRKDERPLAALVIWPAQQRIAIHLRRLAMAFQVARLGGGAGVVAAKGEHIPGQVLV